MNFHEIVAKFKHYWYNKDTYKGAGRNRWPWYLSILTP